MGDFSDYYCGTYPDLCIGSAPEQRCLAMADCIGAAGVSGADITVEVKLGISDPIIADAVCMSESGLYSGQSGNLCIH